MALTNEWNLQGKIALVTGASKGIGLATAKSMLQAETKKPITLRVPYPLGFYTRFVDGRIDDPKAGWKGRGLWSSDDTRVSFHNEGGKGATSYVAHFQLRPDPLAK